jgi:hypothetical protein
MSFRILFGAAIAVALLGVSAPSQAADYRSGYSPKARYHHSRAPYRYRRSFAYRGGVGGHLFGWQLPAWTASSANNYPGFYNNHTFWERVQTQGQYPVQY